MKTRMSRTFVLIVGLSALLSTSAFAAFGDDVAPAASTLDSGGALPPGTHRSSPADNDKKHSTDGKKPPPKQPRHTSPADTTKPAPPKSRSGS